MANGFFEGVRDAAGNFSDFLGDVKSGAGDFLFGTEAELSPEQRQVFAALQRLSSGEGLAPALDPNVAATITSSAGAVQAGAGRAIGGRLASQGTLGGGIGNQALAAITGDRLRSQSDALARLAASGEARNQATRLRALGLQANIAGQPGISEQPGLFQSLLGNTSITDIAALIGGAG